MRQRLWRRTPDGRVVRVEPAPRAVEAPGAAPGAEGVGRPPGGEARPTARLSIALRLGARDAYDYLGVVLLGSLAWTFLAGATIVGGHELAAALVRTLRIGAGTALPGLLAAFLALAIGALACGPLTAGLFRFARNAAARQEPEVFDLAWGYRALSGRSAALAIVQLLVSALLAGNCVFYLAQGRFLPMVLGVLFGYVLAFWCLAMLYQWPLAVGQREEGPPPLSRVLTQSALLVLDNPGYSAALGLCVGALALAVWLPVVPGAMLGAGAGAMFLTQATRELLRKYGLLPPDPTLDPIADETHEFGGHGWHE